MDVLGIPDIRPEIEDFLKETTVIPHKVDNSVVSGHTPPEAFGIDGTLRGFDYSYMNATVGHIILDGDWEGDGSESQEENGDHTDGDDEGG